MRRITKTAHNMGKGMNVNGFKASAIKNVQYQM